MNFNQPRSLRKSMSWLHTWSSLWLGWLLVLVYMTGSLSYFRDEITVWMQPELQASVPQALSVDNVVASLNRLAPQAREWVITLPNERSPVVSASWSQPSDNASSASREGPRGGRPGSQVYLDAATGAQLYPRATAGGTFLYGLHYQLYGLDRFWGRWIVGIATMLMFLAIVTGIIVHKHIFKDIFTFRPGKGKRSWLDGHNASGVLSLPFHLVITLSGLMLLGVQLIPAATRYVYDGDGRAFMMDARQGPSVQPNGSGESSRQTTSGGHRPDDAPGPRDLQHMRDISQRALPSIAKLLDEACIFWPGHKVGKIIIVNPMSSSMRIKMEPIGFGSLAGGVVPPTVEFDAARNWTASFAGARPTDVSTARGVWNVLTNIHQGHALKGLTRWLLFLSGVLGTAMVASGLAMWVISRQKPGQGKNHAGVWLINKLNVVAIAGLLLSIGAYLWANRVIPSSWADRSASEIAVFFATWGVSLVHAMCSCGRRSWTQQLMVAGMLFGTLPILNALTNGSHLGVSLTMGQWQAASVDLSAILMACSLFFIRRKIILHQPATEKSRLVNVEGGQLS